MANPLIPLGSLNRLRGSVVWPSFPSLNVTAPYLGKEGIRLALEGETTTYLPQMTGAVTSPEPYQLISLRITLLKTQGLAALYKAQMEASALLGDGTVRPDASSLPPYEITNCAIESIAELTFNGESADFAVNIRGYYLVNASLWDLA